MTFSTISPQLSYDTRSEPLVISVGVPIIPSDQIYSVLTTPCGRQNSVRLLSCQSADARRPDGHGDGRSLEQCLSCAFLFLPLAPSAAQSWLHDFSFNGSCFPSHIPPHRQV